MQLSVRDAAGLLNVSDKTVYRWISQGRLPAYKINDQIRFNKTELLEWAMSRKINVSVDIFDDGEGPDEPMTGLHDALRAGGIFYRVGGRDVASTLAAVVDLMPLPEGADREFLYQVLKARESLASTGIGNGISIPHTRNPIVMHVSRPMVMLCFLEQPVDFNAIDGLPVHTLFVLVSPVLRNHLHLISRIAYALKQPAFMSVIQNQGTREAIFEAAARIDHSLHSVTAGAGERA